MRFNELTCNTLEFCVAQKNAAAATIKAAAAPGMWPTTKNVATKTANSRQTTTTTTTATGSAQKTAESN